MSTTSTSPGATRSASNRSYRQPQANATPFVSVAPAPLEACDGPHAFLALRQHYHPLHLIERLLALIDDPDAHHDPYNELRTLQYWAAVNRCDRRTINRQLRQDSMVTFESEACS